MKITGKINAYITEYSDIRSESFKNPTDALIPKLYYGPANNTPKGWTLAGEATVTVELVDENTLISNKVAALRGQLQQHLADSHVTQTRLEDQIAKLLAISYEPQS